jgi:hypothetical protein
MPRIPDKCRLLHGPYRPPRLQVGDCAFCHLRGTVVITSWTDARAAAEPTLLGTATTAKVSRQIGRTPGARAVAYTVLTVLR